MRTLSDIEREIRSAALDDHLNRVPPAIRSHSPCRRHHGAAAMIEPATRSEAKRREELASDIARHTVLSGGERDHRVVSALLEAHQPCLVEVDGKWYAECHGCPSYWEHDGYGETGEIRHEWPCPTWSTIAEQTESDS